MVDTRLQSFHTLHPVNWGPRRADGTGAALQKPGLAQPRRSRHMNRPLFCEIQESHNPKSGIKMLDQEACFKNKKAAAAIYGKGIVPY